MWTIRQWAIYIDKVMTSQQSCKKCYHGGSCNKHDEKFWDGINGLRQAVQQEINTKKKKGSKSE